jgi:DNA polymerase I-like protein with 3'-5' exonuclease and polymerase domains
MLLHHLCFPDLEHGLGFIASQLLNKPAWKHLSGTDELTYNCRDADATFQLARLLIPMARYEKVLDLYETVQVPLARICRLLHETGFRIDPARLKTVRADLESKSIELERELPAELKTHQVPVRKRVKAPDGTLSEKTGKPIKYVMTDSTETITPWKSSDVLQEYFYEKARLPVQTHAKTNEATTDKTAIPKLIRAASKRAYTEEVGPELAAEVLRALRALQHLRQIASLLSTFLQDKWENTGVERIHASFNVHGTASGRLSSSEPNLQNIPESARFIYVPSYSDWAIFDVDFSSLENRLTAWFAQDHERLDRLAQPGFNEHKWTTSQFFNIPYCLAPGTRILTANAEWKPVEKLFIGESLVGFDETPSRTSSYRETKVLETRYVELEASEIVTDKVSVTASNEHTWFVKRHEHHCWVRTSDLRVGDLIKYLHAPWEPDLSYEGGYISAILDGEGYVANRKRSPSVGFSQNRGLVLDKILTILNAKGFQTTSTPEDGEPNLEHIRFSGEALPGLHAIGVFRPVRLLEKSAVIWKDRRIWCNYRLHAFVEAVIPRGKQELVAIQTTTKTLIAEGLFSHNSEVVKDNDKSAPYGMAKRIGHGSNYGMGPMKISRLYDMPFSEVKNLCDQWKKVNAKTVEWQLATAAKAKADGYLETPFQRRRWFYTDSAFTESLSFLPQSTGADVVFRCMIALLYDRVGWPESQVQKIVPFYKALPHPARLLVQVHDSLVGEAPISLMPEVIDTLTRVMSQPWPELGGYAIPVEPKVGFSWGEGKAWKP